ncbi:cytochrome c family protein [bacterium]|nr:cytochrome c family protein [bacterium]
MKKKIISVIMAFMFIVSVAGVVFAQDASGPDGNKRKGKYTYKNVYKACAKRGEVESKTPLLSPGDKTMSQWKRVFAKKKFGIFKCSEDWGNLSEDDINNIYTYLYSFAADSPTPAKCK